MSIREEFQQEINHLQEIIDETNRFLKKIKAYKKEIKEAQKQAHYIFVSSKRAAMRRASLDLTKALVSLRKPWRHVK